MRKTRAVGFCLLLLSALVWTGPGQASAQDKAAPKSPPYKFGFIERIRNEYRNNTDMNAAVDDENDYFRIRTSVYGQLTPNPQFMIYGKLTNEWRRYPTSPAPVKNTIHEVVIDNLYVKATSKGKTPVTLTLGRQDIIYGEGFLVLEGTPMDGSRTIYHDAVRLSVKNGPTTVDVFGISNPRQDREIFPVLHQQTGAIQNNAWERALGLYVTNESKKDHKIEGYVIHKRESWAQELKLTTVGGRASRSMKNTKAAWGTEWAVQVGSQGAVDQTSFGGYGWVSVILDPKRPDPKAKGLITAGFALLSGDDPSTLDKNEGWNPLFSRYPKWSELYVYSMAAETAGRPAYATNTLNPYVKFDRTLHKKVSFQGVLYHYRALQARKFRDGSTSGKTRGSEVQALFQFTFNKYVTGHFLFDRFFSGDFYQAPRANGSFIRGELMIRY